jgi:hypothetical protein
VTVECPSCGQVVQIPSFPGWCPACNRRISSLVPPLKTRADQESRTSTESTYSSSLPPSLQVPDGASVERPLPYTEPPRHGRPINILLWIKIGGAVAALVLAFVIVYVLVGKTRAYFARARAPKPAAPTATAVAPAPPPPANSIFDESYVARADSSAPPPPQQVEHAPPRSATTTSSPNVASPVMPKRVIDAKAALTDKAIHDAIDRGVSFLLKQVEGERFDPLSDDFAMQIEGRYALMPMEEGTPVYARACRSLALAVHARRQDRAALAGDLDWLLKASMGGAYYYVMPASKEVRAAQYFDNSNSQYGLLGVWAAAEAGLGVPQSYWEDVEKHWTDTQSGDGGWPYRRGEGSRMTMTAGGVTSMFVAGDMLAASRMAAGVDKPPFKPVLQKGLDWLSTGDNSIAVQDHHGYALYGLERAGLASGFKRFGKHDWFRVLAEGVVTNQRDDGAWVGQDGVRPETSFRILFLARGRHPIMMNKLRFDGAWANRPRDVARLADFVYDSIERPVNWQVVNLSDGWTEWIDAPIAFLASHDPVTVTDENVKQLRAYVDNGGLLFTHADADSRTFTAFAEELARRAFPEYELRDLPPTHDVYSMVYKMAGEKVPPLRGLSNGSRLLMIHSPTDLGAQWQNRLPKARPIPFQIGANVFVYATGKAALRNRLDTPIVPETPGDPLATFTVARVKHAGPWNPEPGAWPRMAKWFRRETNVALDIVPTEPAALRRSVTPFAHLTTTTPWKPSEKELDSIRNFVREGGMLVLDPCGGSPDLALALHRDIAQAAFPDQTVRDANEKDQFIAGTGAGMVNLTKPLLRVYAVEQLGNNLPTLQIMPVGKGWIVISKLDVVSGLLGTNTWGILGYDPNYAQPLMKNLILYACNGRMLLAPPSPSTEPVIEPPPAP